MGFFTSCSSSYKVFTNGQYENATEPSLLDDKFNEADIQSISSKMINSLALCSKNTKHKTVALGEIANKTNEHMDLDMILHRIKGDLIKNNNFYFIDKHNRVAINEEVDYQNQSGKVLSSTVNDYKGQIGANYLLTGSIHSNVQQVNDNKQVYYYISLHLVNLQTSMIDCVEEKEIKKSFTLKSF